LQHGGVMSTHSRTSFSHPIRVGWLPSLPDLGPGRVGLTFAPGKKQRDAATGPWDRDLDVDLRCLREEFGVEHLVCLLEDQELDSLAIADLPSAAPANGLEFSRLPIADSSVPADLAAVQALVVRILESAAAGKNVVVHCKGGLGRAGTIGGCVLRAAGLDGPSALKALKDARGEKCPETQAQREYVRQFPAPSHG